jgi:p-hydroxybenzoate 3-monooxygenase
MTALLHRFPDQTDLEQRLQEAELAYIQHSERAQAAVSEQHNGMPFES